MPRKSNKNDTSRGRSKLSDWERAELILASAMALREWVLIFGPPGTGKSRFARTFGLDAPTRYQISLSEETSVVDLVGRDRLVRNEFTFYEGPAIKAWRHGGRLLLDEIEKPDGMIHTTLLGLLDDPEFASYELPDGTIVRPSPGFHVVATGNCEDPDTELPPALADRFTVRIRIDTPHPEAVAALSKDLRALAMNSAACPELKRHIGVRGLRAFDGLRGTGVPPSEAGVAVWGDRAHDVLAAIQLGGV